MTIYVKVFKKKDGNDCIALCANNGKIEKVLSFDRYTISDYLGCKKRDLSELPLGKHHIVEVFPHDLGKEK